MRGVWVAVALVALVLGIGPGSAWAQSNEEILKRMEALERRVKELEAEKAAREQADREKAEREKAAAATAAAKPPSGGAPAAPGGAKVELPAGAGPGTTPPKPPEKPWYERLKVGGQVRIRGEVRDPIDYRVPGTFGRPATELAEDADEFLLLRTRLWVDATPAENIRAYVQIQDSRTFGEEASVLADDKGVDLHQGFMEFANVFGSKLTVRAGRQELSFGDQRLVSPLDYSNVGRSWDGARFTWNEASWSADLFSTTIHEGGLALEDKYFHGLYFSYKGVADHTLDAYVFRRNFGDKPVAGERAPLHFGNINDWTPGLRVKGKLGQFDYSGEFAYQTGTHGGDDEDAWATAITAGYTFDCAWKPRVGIEYDFATGDAHPFDGHYSTFDPLFPFGHSYQGLMDLFSWRNGHDAEFSFSVAPLDWMKLYLDEHNFWLDHKRDGWYGAAGTIIRRAPLGSPDPYVGSEIDVHSKITVAPAVDIWVGYSHFFAGDYVHDTGEDEDMDWFFLQTAVKF